jgi:hypothetical protein
MNSDKAAQRSTLSRIGWIISTMLIVLGGAERAASWIAGETVGDFAKAFEKIAGWIDAVPLLGNPAVQTALFILALIGFVASGWLVWFQHERPTLEIGEQFTATPLNPAQPIAPQPATTNPPDPIPPPAIPAQTASNDAPMRWGEYPADAAKIQRAKNEIDEWIIKRMALQARVSYFNDLTANENSDDRIYRDVITEFMRDAKWYCEARAVDHWVSIGFSTLVEWKPSFQQQRDATLNRLFTAAFKKMEANSFPMHNCEKFAEVVRRLVVERRRHGF